MLLYIGQKLAEQRKRRKITQQELADFIGVTKASVSKWETGQSYPDITLLPLLAAYFDLSIDDLLNYHSQLAPAEIQNIYRSLQESLKKSREETWEALQRLLKNYYSCYPFVMQMGLFIINHRDLLPSGRDYGKEAKELFERVAKNTGDAQLLDAATKMAAQCSLLLGETEEVFALLGEQAPVLLPAEPLIAGAYQQKGDLQAAISVSQSGLFQQMVVLMSGLTNYLQLLLEQPQTFSETFARGEKIAAAFQLQQLHPVLYLNFLSSAIVGFASFELEEELFATLETFSQLLQQIEFPATLHGYAYFDHIEDWIATLDLGNQIPRETSLVAQDFLDLLQHHPALANYQNDPRLQNLIH